MKSTKPSKLPQMRLNAIPTEAEFFQSPRLKSSRWTRIRPGMLIKRKSWSEKISFVEWVQLDDFFVRVRVRDINDMRTSHVWTFSRKSSADILAWKDIRIFSKLEEQ